MLYYIKAWSKEGEVHSSINLDNSTAPYDRTSSLIKAAEHIYFSKFKDPTWHAEFVNANGDKINL